MTAAPRIVVAGTSSGVGKTTVTVALARSLASLGLRVAVFKCGPDYLDPTYHARATGTASQTLDGWMMGRDAVVATFTDGSRDADVSIIEGMMGLFDGASATDDSGSTAEIARWLDAPVLLVVDASGMARSLAAVVHGFASFDPRVRVAGVVANRVGGRGHLDVLRRARTAPPVLGGLPLDVEHAFAERHLGLRMADEATVPEACIDHWGDLGAAWLSPEAVVAVARTAPVLEVVERARPGAAASVCRIGVARDEAFHFYYADNLRRLEDLGADLVLFSPTRDRQLPAVDGLYLGGGYPEAFARELSANRTMRDSVRAFAERGGPVYAECGGLMYLSRAIVTAEGARHEMAAVLPTDACMRASLQTIGYVEIETTADTVLGPPGTRFRGHQFRHSELSPAPEAADVQRVYAARGRGEHGAPAEGYRTRRTVASYVHAHWASSPEVPAAFVRACARFREESLP
jgi:cobyrinic acid a,c-diamide synthase